MAGRHILVVTDRDWSHPQGGGTGTNLHGQVRWWLEAGHRVSVIACGYPGGPPYEQSGALAIHRLGGRKTVFPRAIFEQARWLVPDPDVVLEVINGLTFLTPLWMRTPRVALVHHIHRRHYVEEMGWKGHLAAMALESAPLRTLYRTTQFMTVSQASAVEIAGLGIPRGRIVVNYNGVDVDELRPGRRAPRPEILYLGRLKRYKRIEWLLDALQALPEALLHIAGQGEHRPHVEQAIAERGLGDRVVLHGFVDEQRKRELLQRSWVNVTASSVEGWCLTVMEAAACGTPSVAVGVGGLPEAIYDGRTGLVAEDRVSLADKIARVVRDGDLRDRLGRAARTRAETLTWRATAQRSLAVLEGERERRMARPEVERPAFGVTVPRTGRFRRGGGGAVAREPGEAVLSRTATSVALRPRSARPGASARASR